ncbi:MAG: hypothetical protein FJW99_01060 [Actinobacteria bacterium]|nr:hypothetical protein [Actinomycetota bacterium]
MLDLNAHILPGIHAATPGRPEAVAAAEALVRAGVGSAVAPAIVGDDAAADMDAADAARADLATALADRSIALDLLPGAVVPIERVAGLSPDLIARATAGGGGRWLVVALPPAGWPLGLADLMQGLEMGGINLVIAHPERAASVQASKDRLRDLLGRGALVQLGAGSLSGLHGARAERTAFDLLRNGMVTVVASDEPSPTGHALDFGGVLTALEGVTRRPREEVDWMLNTGPRRIAAGEPVRPPRLVPLPRGGA